MVKGHIIFNSAVFQFSTLTFSSSKASVLLLFLVQFARFCLISYLPLALVSNTCICAKTKNTDSLFYTVISVFLFHLLESISTQQCQTCGKCCSNSHFPASLLHDCVLYFPARDVNTDRSCGKEQYSNKKLYLEEENKVKQLFAARVVAAYERLEGKRYLFNVVFILTELLNVGA